MQVDPIDFALICTVFTVIGFVGGWMVGAADGRSRARTRGVRDGRETP